jgi:hypothetical protein
MQQPATISKNGELSTDMTSYGNANEAADVVPDVAASAGDDGSTDKDEVARDGL